jgi:hypothetical protein
MLGDYRLELEYYIDKKSGHVRKLTRVEYMRLYVDMKKQYRDERAKKSIVSCLQINDPNNFLEPVSKINGIKCIIRHIFKID